jgi:superfamily I DNA/RNA helicase
VAHPQVRSFFACGDFNQRLTVWGARSTDDVKWIFPDVNIRTVSISYRQSRQLNQLARGIVRAVGGPDQEVTLPERVDAEGVPPALAESTASATEVVNWLAPRILEVARFLGRLPSTAIFVNSESEVEPLAQELNAALVEHNVQVVPCVQGRVRGQDSDVRVFHIEHIKGLEFEVVFFVGVDRLARLHPDLLDKYLYVGITRAATYLGITCESSLPAQIEVLRPMFVSDWAST